MKKLFTVLIILVAPYCFADDSHAIRDMKTAFGSFFQTNIDMIEQLGSRLYDPDTDPAPVTAPEDVTHKKKYVDFAPTAIVLSTPTAQAPVTYEFTSSSAWGDSTIKIINKFTHFEIHGLCTAQLEKWILKKDNSDKTEIASGALNDQNTFVADIPGPFKDGLSLTLMVVTPDNQYPVLVELH